VGGFIKKWKPIRFWIPSLLLFSLWSSGQARATPLLAFIALPFLADISRTHWKRVRPLAIGLTLIFMGVYLKKSLHAFPNSLVQWDMFPVKACDFIKNNQIDGRPFTTLRFGDYYTWAKDPSQKTFMYGSYLFLPLIAETENLIAANPLNPFQWNKFIERHKFDFTLTPYSSPRYSIAKKNLPFSYSMMEIIFPRKKWALIYFDDISFILIKRKPENYNLIQRLEYRYLWPVNLDLLTHEINSRRIPRNPYLIELERHRTQAGETRIGYKLKRLIS